MMDQKLILKKKDWDNLIVLDACRYDIFKVLWSLEDRVYPALSPASWTLEWLKEVFDDYVDAIVFSSTPYINSLYKIKLNGICWSPKKHFRKIIDLWLFGWDEKLGTVPPWKVYASVVSNLHISRKREHKIKSYKKRIIWFLQPHYPYLANELFTALLKRIFDKIEYRDFIVGRFDFLLRNLALKMASKNITLIRRAYEENLDITLQYVYKLLDKLRGVTIITSDHGELLGEILTDQIISSVKNILVETFRRRSSKYLQRRLFLTCNLITRSLKMNRGTKTAAGYISHGRVFFHPPLLFSTELRKVPLVIIEN